MSRLTTAALCAIGCYTLIAPVEAMTKKSDYITVAIEADALQNITGNTSTSGQRFLFVNSIDLIQDKAEALEAIKQRRCLVNCGGTFRLLNRESTAMPALILYDMTAALQ